MRNASLKEKLQNNLRVLQIKDIQKYHLTHDFYSGGKLNSNCKFNHTQGSSDRDHNILLEQQDLDVINELLFPNPTMGNVFADALSGLIPAKGEDKKHLHESDIQIASIKPSEDLLSRLKDFYNLYLETGLRSLLLKQSDRLEKKNIEIIQNAYSKNIVQNICILSEFWVRDPLSWIPDNGNSLLEHLFVEYQAPPCLKKCWYKTATEENLQWLMSYILYVQGGSVKLMATNFEWAVASNKLWHQLFQAPAHLSPDEAVLYCEVKRLNGSDDIYKAITANQAYAINLLSNPNKSTVEFWYSMVRWITLNEDQIIGTEMSRILIWARHQFTEFAKTGKLFTMNGRSCTKVQKETLDYHRAIVARRLEMARRIELRRLAAIARQEEEDARAEEARVIEYDNYYLSPSLSWEKLGLSSYVPRKSNDQWQFVELTTSAELSREGELMDNCVAGYDESCNEGLSAIVSLRFNGKNRVTIEIDPETRTLIQALGYQNQDINQDEKRLIKQWLRNL